MHRGIRSWGFFVLCALASISCSDDPLPPPGNPVCGNGILEQGEECDDWNTNDGDGCSSRCREVSPAMCGNGVLEAGELCDDGNSNNDDECANNCRFNEDAGPMMDGSTPDSARMCTDGETTCSGMCTDTMTDAANCGTCGTACGAGLGCTAGECDCAAGEMSCGGTCVDTMTDATNCGGCGTTCDAGVTCTDGACDCPEMQTSCGGACVDTNTSTEHCGGCGLPCGADATCNAGSCCGSTTCGGACVDTATDPMHCGACDMMCATGESCITSSCLVVRRLEFVLEWDVPADMDLRALRAGDGEEIYFLNEMPAAGPGGVDGELDADDRTGMGPERIGFDTPIAGDYSICVDPYEVSGPTNWTLRVRENGIVVETLMGTATSSSDGTTCTAAAADLTYSFTL